MPRPEVNRFGEMEVFVRVVELGGFSAAAQATRVTPSAVSKLVSRLEARLGSRLLNRSTRQVQLTPEGCAFYERATGILADLEDAEQKASAGEEAVGRLRLSTSASYFNHVLALVLPRFLELHPRVKLDIVRTDTVVDLLAERTDVAVRAGPLKSSSLMVRSLGESAMIIAAAPDYFARHGHPRSMADLARHDCLGLGYARTGGQWPRPDIGKTPVGPAVNRVTSSDGEGIRQLALAGAGIARLAEFTIRHDLAAGRLVPAKVELQSDETEAFHALYVGHSSPLPSRVRAMLDFLATHGRVH